MHEFALVLSVVAISCSACGQAVELGQPDDQVEIPDGQTTPTPWISTEPEITGLLFGDGTTNMTMTAGTAGASFELKITGTHLVLRGSAYEILGLQAQAELMPHSTQDHVLLRVDLDWTPQGAYDIRVKTADTTSPTVWLTLVAENVGAGPVIDGMTFGDGSTDPKNIDPDVDGDRITLLVDGRSLPVAGGGVTLLGLPTAFDIEPASTDARLVLGLSLTGVADGTYVLQVDIDAVRSPTLSLTVSRAGPPDPDPMTIDSITFGNGSTAPKTVDLDGDAPNVILKVHGSGLPVDGSGSSLFGIPVTPNVKPTSTVDRLVLGVPLSGVTDGTYHIGVDIDGIRSDELQLTVTGGASTDDLDVALPAQADWVNGGTVLQQGPAGAWDARFEGAISPSTVIKREGTYLLYYVGADGDRSTDGGPRHRALGVATSVDGVNFTKYTGNPILTFLPHNNEEEGIFSAGAFLKGNGEVVLYYSACDAGNSTSDSVNCDGRVAVSSDGLTFTDLSEVLDHGSSMWGHGDEIFPIGTTRIGSTWHVYYIAKGANGVSWDLGLASGSRGNLSTTTEVLSSATPISGGGDPVWLGPDKLAVFLVRDEGAAGIEVRTASSLSPEGLSAPGRTYNFTNLRQTVAVYLDRDAETWLMYYLNNQGNRIRLRTAPVTYRQPGTADQPTPAEIDFWLHTDVSGWAETSHITDVSFSSTQICIEHSKSGQWPVVNLDSTDLEGNPWVITQYNGQWYAATYEWLRPGETCKWVTPYDIGAHTKQAPLETWVPASGEVVGFMVSTLARLGSQSPLEERSDIHWTTWP